LILFRLSIAWGKTVEELADTLTAKQLREYARYYAIEPWGCEAADWRHQALAFTVAQSQSTKKLKPDEYAPPWRKPVKRIVPYSVGAVVFAAHLAQRQRVASQRKT
jgi:hypothetical protein